MSLSDSRPEHPAQLCIPTRRLCSLLLLDGTALSGLPGPPRLFFPRALSPLTPEMPSDCLSSVASSLVAGFILFGRLAAFISLCVNEAEAGLLITTARVFARARPRQQDCSRSRSHQLPAERTIDKVNSLQFTRTARLTWRYRTTRNKVRNVSFFVPLCVSSWIVFARDRETSRPKVRT